MQSCDWALAHGQRSALAQRGVAHRKLGQLKEAMRDADEAADDQIIDVISIYYIISRLK